MDSSLGPVGWRRGGQLFTVLIAIACGLAGAFGAVVFRLLIRLFQGAFFGGAEGVVDVVEEGLLAEAGDPLEIARTLSSWRIVIAPAVGGLIVGPLVYFLAREARGHGVPEVMEAVALRGGVMRPRVVAVKTLASAISIGSGGSVGREGPIVQIGSAIGSVLGQWLNVPTRQLRTIVGCGAAAGIAATFNAPIAGALFAVEVIVGDFAVTQFSPIVISAVVATVVSRSILGNHPAFVIPDFEVGPPIELLGFMVVGVIAGLVGTGFVRVLYGTEDLFLNKVPLPEWSKACLGGLLIGCMAVFLPEILGVGYSAITDALNGKLPLLMLGALLGAKILATSVTIGSGGSGGVFAPSLFLGAMTGGFFGMLLNKVAPTLASDPGLYSLVTMGAMVAATTHAPLSAMIIIFEMTQKIDIIPPVMAACVVSSLIAMRLSKESIYTMKLKRRGVDLHREDHPNLLKQLFVREIVDREPGTVTASARLEEVLTHVVEGDHTELFVVNDAGQLLGAIHFTELRRVILEQDSLRSLVVAGDLLERNRATVVEDDDLDVAMRVFSESSVEEIAVVSNEDPRLLVGSLHKRDVLVAYNQEVMRRDLAGSVSATVSVLDRVHQVDLGGGFALQEIMAPRRFVGRSLREIDLRRTSGVQALLLRSPGGEEGRGRIRVPGPGDVIGAGDHIVVAGQKAAVDVLAE
jgi:CIC family chloride channel protein